MIDDFLIWSEEGGLAIVLYAFAIGLSLRFLFFVGRLLYAELGARHAYGLLTTAFNILRALLPYHRRALKAPFYAGLRYVFHACLFIVPIWFSGHVTMWEESSLEWYWIPMDDKTADLMTLAVIGIGVFLIARRIVIPKIRRRSAPVDIVVITITVLPFLTGYFYTHGTLNKIAFFSDYLWYFHVISGEAMLLMMIVMFCVTRLNEADCVGCAACVLNCPTRTLESCTDPESRIFRYSHYQCICCASCVDTCPEGAAELRHEISIAYFFNMFEKRIIRNVQLARCDQCGACYGPEPQIIRLAAKLEQGESSVQTIHLCNRCKKIMSAHRLGHSTMNSAHP